jgi:hypothetical protein
MVSEIDGIHDRGRGHKPPKYIDIPIKPRAAFYLLTIRPMSRLLAMLLFLPACLLPPQVDEVSAPKNQPPRIEPNALSPTPQSGPVFMSVDCPSYSFYAAISDPDAEDTLYYRIFLDYSRDPRKLFTDVKRIASDNGQADTKAISFKINPNDERFADGDLTYTEPHAVELFVADRPFFDGPEPEGRVVDADGLVATFVWPIQLAATADPSCAGGAP